MISLKNFLDLLGNAELATIKLVDPSGSYTQKDIDTVVPSIQLGLTKIYSKFHIKVESCHIRQEAYIQDYVLNSKYALSSSDVVDVKYILDSPIYPFTGNVLRILDVFDEAGNKIPLNDINNPDSSTTVNLKTLRVHRPVEGNILKVNFLADHIKLSKDLSKIDETVIDIADQFIEPLIYFVASRAINQKGGQNTISESMRYKAMFDNAMREISETGVAEVHDNTSIKFEQGGWC